MSSRRLVRVAEVLKNELARLIARERALEGSLVTITSVEVTPDLKQAFIYVSKLNDEWREEDILSALGNLKSDWQKEIGRQLRTKFTPRLTYRFDDAQQRGDRVMQILNSIEVPPEKA